jgi:predicted transcriptional regulator
MFIQIRNLELPSSEKLTLFVLATHLPNIFPSTTLIANETGLSRRTVQTSLNNLKQKKIISWEKTNGANRYKILIENDSVVQPLHNHWATTAQPLGNDCTTVEQPLHTKIQSKKQTKKQIKKEENFSKEFDLFWDAYPKVRSSKKSDVSRLIERALKNGTSIEKILSDLEQFLETVDKPKYTPRHTSWLNTMMDDGRWDEEFYKGKISRQVSAIEKLKAYWEKRKLGRKEVYETESALEIEKQRIETAWKEATDEQKKELRELAPEGVNLPKFESTVVHFKTTPSMRAVQ